MTIHRRSYRPFEGDRRSPGRLFWTITRLELRLGFKKRWVRRLLMLSGIPMVALMFALYVQLVVEKALDTPLLGLDLFENLYRAQIFFAVLLMAALGADIIAKDVASHAHQLYFSRPLTRFQYLIGKVVSVAIVLSIVIVAPGLLLALAQLLLAPEQDWAELGRLVVAIAVWGAVLSGAAAAIIACLSAFGRRARYVGAIWVGLYFFSGAASGALYELTDRSEWTRVVSVHEMFVDSGRFFYDRPSPGPLALFVLLALALLSVAVLYRRLGALERSES